MEAGEAKRGSSGGSSAPPPQPAKFSVYQNRAFSTALTVTSLRPSTSTVLFLFSLSSASAFAFLAFSSRQNRITNNFKLRILSDHLGYLITRVTQIIMGVIFMGSALAFLKALSLRMLRISEGSLTTCLFNGAKEEVCLTNRQLGLLGIQAKTEKTAPDMTKRPPKSKSLMSSTVSEPLVPLHQPVFSSNRASRLGADKPNTGAQRTQAFGTPSKSPVSPSSPYLLSSPNAQIPSVQTSPALVSTPWLSKRASPAREIITEEELEQFLADLDKKITESAEKQATPTTTRNGFRIASPSSISNSASTVGTTRTTPLRSVRMSPGSQKFNTPPKKGEGELPSPMSMEESLEAFENLGVYPEIEQWHDRLRQWFSSVLLNPLLSKTETSHIQVMQSAAKLGVSITLSPIGSDSPTTTPPIATPMDQSKEWKPALSLDEDGILHQLRASLVQFLDAATQKSPIASLHQSLQQNALLPISQECVNFITEHQRLQTLMKGELIKGLLPQSSIPAEYTVQRIRELAEGTCLKNYEYMRSGEAYDEAKKKWIIDLPSDSHLLFYLFCAFLEYPKWMMLHVDPSSYSGAQSSKNPLFLGVLPPKERFPEKYTAIVPSVPSTLHPGACVIAMGRQHPPIFALYWDKKLQFALQGRTALWDSILLLCYTIKNGYGGFIRGIHLGSSSLNILPVLESEDED